MGCGGLPQSNEQKAGPAFHCAAAGKRERRQLFTLLVPPWSRRAEFQPGSREIPLRESGIAHHGCKGVSGWPLSMLVAVHSDW